MSITKRLGLGTVQFGIDYGLTNTSGKVSEDDVADILARAKATGIRTIDTACLYGDSEAVLGHALPRGGDFHLVSKTPVCGNAEITLDFLDAVEVALENSLNLMGQQSLYGLLVHQAADLLKPGAANLVRKMEAFRTEGLVSHIGFSIYNVHELESVLEVFQPDIIQLPFNILDQRLAVSGTLMELKKAGVEIHARSLFLQGALLAEPIDLPEFFDPARAHLDAIADIAAQEGIGRLGMCLLAGLSRPELDVLLVGVTGLSELEQILELMPQLSELQIDMQRFAFNDEAILNPALWPTV